MFPEKRGGSPLGQLYAEAIWVAISHPSPVSFHTAHIHGSEQTEPAEQMDYITDLTS